MSDDEDQESEHEVDKFVAPVDSNQKKGKEDEIDKDSGNISERDLDEMTENIQQSDKPDKTIDQIKQ